MPPARCAAFLVQERVPPGLELLIGIRHDPIYGPMVVVGAGGVLVELLSDVVSCPAPIGPDAAERLLRRLRLAPLFDGVRASPALDLAAAADAVSRMSWLAADLGANWVDAEINPLIVAPRAGAPRRGCAYRFRSAGGLTPARKGGVSGWFAFP